MTENRGGPRTPGPGKKIGAPKKPDKKLPISAKVTPDVEAYLRSVGVSIEIERAVRASKGFREWAKNQ